MHWLWLTAPGAFMWVGLLLLPWRPWSTRERLDAPADALPADPARITVLIPARDEAAGIGRTLRSVARQAPGIRVVLVDDESTDGTAEAARGASEGLRLEVVAGRPTPPGWSGKLWALQQGLERVGTPRVLLLDADIELEPGILAALDRHMDREGAALASLMATLSTRGFWSGLLVPAFVWFFKLLYPFRLANDPRSRVAAAAGGCALVDTAVLGEAGGFEAIRGELIDDCALARLLKRSGHGSWIGLSRSVTSHRPYRDLRSVWNMVARSAYTQLHYSPVLLASVVLTMLLAFVMPVAGLAAPLPAARAASVAALAAMTVAQQPLLRYWGLSPLRALALPLAGVLYLAMTVHSAVRYHTGTRSVWRGRRYRRD